MSRVSPSFRKSGTRVNKYFSLKQNTDNMKLDGRRMSTNVDDRRKKGGTAAKVGGGIGIGGIIIALIVWFLGGEAPNVGTILQDVQSTASTWVDSKTQEQMATFRYCYHGMWSSSGKMHRTILLLCR